MGIKIRNCFVYRFYVRDVYLELSLAKCCFYEWQFCLAFWIFILIHRIFSYVNAAGRSLGRMWIWPKSYTQSDTQRPITTKMNMIGHDLKTLSVIYQQDVMQSAHTAELCYFTKSYVHHYYLLHEMNTKLHECKCIHQLLFFWTNTELY